MSPPVAMAVALVIGMACGGLAVDAQQSSLRDYLVGPQDTLRITVFNEDELSDVYPVDRDGSITFPYIGQVSVNGLTLHGVEVEITRLLADGYLVNPQVTSEIADFRLTVFYVLGEVNTPGQHSLPGNPSLLDALSAAGAITPQAGNEVQIIRSPTGAASAGPVLAQGGDPEVEVTVVSLDELRSGLLARVTVGDGDTVNVLKAATFFVTGEVSSPGPYVWIQGMTVRQAIALASGYTNRGSSRGIKIERMVDDVKMEVGVNEDDLVQPDDTLKIRRRRF